MKSIFIFRVEWSVPLNNGVPMPQLGLGDEEMAAIDALNENFRFGPDPDELF